MYSTEDYPIGELEKGYVEDQQAYRCLFCAEKVAKGVIYPVENVLYEDWRYMEHHLESVHGSVFDMLLASGRDHTGLSDQQSKLLALIYEFFTFSTSSKLNSLLVPSSSCTFTAMVPLPLDTD